MSGGGGAAAGGGCARQNLDSLNEAQALLVQVQGVDDAEVLRQNQRLRELIELYRGHQEAVQDGPGGLDRIRTELIQQFIVPGLSHIDMRMLVCLFKVDEFDSTNPKGLSLQEYNRLVDNFIKNKCLVALTELLSLPRIFQFVFELFLHFYYGKSKVRILIAATYASSKTIAAIFLAKPIARLTLPGCGITFQIMVYLFQFVNNPDKLIAELNGSTVGNLLKHVVPVGVKETISELFAVLRNNATQPLVLAAAISEILMYLIEYIQDPRIQAELAAAAAAAAPAPAGAAAGGAPGGFVGNAQYYVMMGGKYVYRCGQSNIQKIRGNLSSMLGPAQLGSAEDSHMRRLCNTAVNGIIFMSDTFDQQADRAFTPDQKNKIKAIESINALLPSKLRNALEAGDEASAYTEISMLCMSIAPRVRVFCPFEPAITEDQVNLIASGFFNSGFTKEVLDAYVEKMPFPRFEDVEITESMKPGAPESQTISQQLFTLEPDMVIVLQNSEPLTPDEVKLKKRAIKGLLGWGISTVSSTIKGGVSFCMDTVLAPAASIFEDYKHTFVAGRDPASITVSPLPLERVILSRVLHLVQKQKNAERLTNDEKIVLNSFLRTWAHDPDAVRYHDFKMSNGEIEKRWFLNLGSLVCCFREGVVQIDKTQLIGDPDPYNDVAKWFPVAVQETKKLLSCTKDTLSVAASSAVGTVANVWKSAMTYFESNQDEVIMVVRDERDNAVRQDDAQLVAGVAAAAAAGGAQGGNAASNPDANKDVDLKIQVAAAVSDVLADDAAAAAAGGGGGGVVAGEGNVDMTSLDSNTTLNLQAADNPPPLIPIGAGKNDISQPGIPGLGNIVTPQSNPSEVSGEGRGGGAAVPFTAQASDANEDGMSSLAAAADAEAADAATGRSTGKFGVPHGEPPGPSRSGGKSRRKSRKNAKRTRRYSKGRKSSKAAKKTQQRRSSRYRRSSRKGRK